MIAEDYGTQTTTDLKASWNDGFTEVFNPISSVPVPPPHLCENRHVTNQAQLHVFQQLSEAA
jgi:hypothetical protein